MCHTHQRDLDIHTSAEILIQVPPSLATMTIFFQGLPDSQALFTYICVCEAAKTFIKRVLGVAASMGKNQQHKAMQRSRHGSGEEGGADQSNEEGRDVSFHTPAWHAARLAALTVERVSYEDWKKQKKDEEAARQAHFLFTALL